MDKNQYQKSKYKADIKQVVMACDSMRRDPEGPLDVSFSDFINKKWGIGLDSLFADLGMNPSLDTIQNMFTMPDDSVRWLVPEIIRDALRLGLRKNPIWADLIAAEQTVKNPTVVLPYFNMSDAAPKYVGEGENIPLGALSFGQKSLKIRKIGRGVKIPYEVLNYVAVNIVGIFLQDFGVKLNQAIDALLIDVLINGEQTNGSESAPVVGITTPGTFVYRDLLRIWIRMSRIGKQPSAIIGGETASLNTLDLTEFKTRQNVGPTFKELNIKTPIPQSSDYYIHGSVPNNQQIVVDPTACVVKYNAQPLLIESDKIISNQTVETYASLTTGFGILFRDARVIIDSSLNFGTNGFPAYMNVDALEQVVIE